MLMDELLAPFADHLAESIGLAGASRILDIGCGPGATTLAAARRLGWAGRATGVDISQPMIYLARARATTDGSPAEFHCADAQAYDFPHTAFDIAVPRIGGLFFRASGGAFAPIRRARNRAVYG